MNTETTNPRIFVRSALNTGTRIWVHYRDFGSLVEAEGFVLSETRNQFTVQDEAGELLDLHYQQVEEMQPAL